MKQMLMFLLFGFLAIPVTSQAGDCESNLVPIVELSSKFQSDEKFSVEQLFDLFSRARRNNLVVAQWEWRNYMRSHNDIEDPSSYEFTINTNIDEVNVVEHQGKPAVQVKRGYHYFYYKGDSHHPTFFAFFEQPRTISRRLGMKIPGVWTTALPFLLKPHVDRALVRITNVKYDGRIRQEAGLLAGIREDSLDVEISGVAMSNTPFRSIDSVEIFRKINE